MNRLITRIRTLFSTLRTRAIAVFTRYRGLRRWQQITIAVLVLGLLFLLGSLFGGGTKDDGADTSRFVSLATVGELSGSSSGVSMIGSVRSVSEAAILAKTGGMVTRVHTQVGSYVPAGAVIAELENASERAAVLQAEGAYDATIAAKSTLSLSDTEGTARDTFRSTFTTLDTSLRNEVDLFFGLPTPIGPELLVSAEYSVRERLSKERRALTTEMTSFEATLASAGTENPEALLTRAETLTRRIQTFLNQLADAANQRNSGATPQQIAGLASARATMNGVLSSLTQARSGLRAGSVSATAGADASVKQALGMLRAAQANLERTIVRAPIGGQVNFLPIRTGEYVTPMQHVATVAQNGALEIVAYVGEHNRELLTVGTKVEIAGDHEGIVTSIAPALDPITKRIEVRIAVSEGEGLVNGQSVSIALPGATVETVANEQGPVLLPLAAVKLRIQDRIVFTVNEESRLVAMPVEVGDVRGDRIEIRSTLPADTFIVSDARGLSEGERVRTTAQ